MDIDPDITNWILEFLVRQPLGERTLTSLIRALPLPNDNLSANLQKSLLLKKLEAEVSQRLLLESTLHLLEQLEEIELKRGNNPSDAMKRAYCAVAVDCTLRPLKHVDDGDDVTKFDFFARVKRLWRGRVHRMDKDAEKGGLYSELLWAWKDDIEAAVWEDNFCKSLLNKFDGLEAELAVKAYLREETEKMAPSFLELVAERVKTEEGLQKIMGVDAIHDRVAEAEAPSSCVDRAPNGSNASKEMHTGKIKLRDKLVGLRRLKGTASRGAKIVDTDETAAEPSGRRNSLQHSAEVNRVRESLESRSLELRAVVKDPLPEALRVAEAICKEVRQDKHQDPAENNNVGPKLFVVDVYGVVQSASDNENNKPKPSLMERNNSAHTYEWDDSIDGSPEDIAGRTMIQLPSPKRINSSPLKIYDMNGLKKRRKGRRWSPMEEEALRKGVEKYGKGCWKVILLSNQEVFEGRTEVDLKDKWRNMMRY